MNVVNNHKTGFVLGVLLGLSHLMWVLLVAAGIAQPLLDWIFRLHFIQPVYTVGSFQTGTAIGLIAFTSALGYVIGWLGAALWNRGCCTTKNERGTNRE